MKQILLITDGGSNVGESPVVAAAQAYAEGIVVNVAGVVDDGAIGEHGAAEIAEIARAGGGMSRIVATPQLSGTVQMMTRKTVAATVQQAVNHELRQLFGVGSVAELPPAKRAEVVRVMEEIGETAELRVALLIDASASMRPKLSAVEEAIRDLSLSLQAREGNSLAAVFHFPGEFGDEACVMDSGWTGAVDRIRMLSGKLKMRGTTPTGPALQRVLEFFRETCGNIMVEPVQTSSLAKRDETLEVRSDYVV
ncbi:MULTISPECIES: VWA domain-containing protein [Cohnella]|uniref:VWA domain-containing protein n=1 Tax=Cohnella TaxID=329857 RepID=UPI0009BA4B78|nr:MULTISPECIES: VWA domain-containing protein [Cohnella]MBN2981256.1 VWA domain-containing protein [Cohnella algarum]